MPAKKPLPPKVPRQIRPGLTAKQDAFILAYLETGDAKEAYRKSYDADGMNDASIDRESRRLLEHPRIAPYLIKLNSTAQAKALLSLEDHMKELQNLRDLAKNDGKWSAAIQAEVKRGELRRFYVTQVEQGDKGDFENASEQELDEYIKQNADLVPVSQQKAARATKH